MTPRLSLLSLLPLLLPALALPTTWSRHAPARQPADLSRLRDPATFPAPLPFPADPHPHPSPTCIPSSSSPPSSYDDLSALLQSHLRNPGDVLALCPGHTYALSWPLNFTAPDQEIVTLGYPTDHTRALLVVSGHLTGLNANHSTAINGQCAACDRVKVRHVQVDGQRDPDAEILQGGGANIAMGGSTSGQVVEYTRSFDPRAWSCLHVHEGQHACRGATVVNNDIGPCGFSEYDEWADGISLSCRDSYVAGNLVRDATDGGIVVFGAPGSVVERNTVWAVNRTLLGGINMVDYDPWAGDYAGTVVQHNLIVGGVPGQDLADPASLPAFVKVGIAVGPRIWFGDSRHNGSAVAGGTVRNNVFTGAFGYAVAVSGARGFTVGGNVLSGETAFVGVAGPTCTFELRPTAWVWDSLTVGASVLSVPGVPGAEGAGGDGPQGEGAEGVDGFVDEEADMAICLLKPGDEAVWEEWIWDEDVQGMEGPGAGGGALRAVRERPGVQSGVAIGGDGGDGDGDGEGSGDVDGGGDADGGGGEDGERTWREEEDEFMLDRERERESGQVVMAVVHEL